MIRSSMLRGLLMTLFSLQILFAVDPYEIGHGVKFSNAFTLGSYFSTEYEIGSEHAFTLDDIAFFGFGDLSDNVSYMLELEAIRFYKKSFSTLAQEFNPTFHLERVYVDYKNSETFKFRLGRQITPIGYWNLEPINVLRDTTSNPLLTTYIFPKFLTGLDMYGYIPFLESTQYHLFIQETQDLDVSYLNISSDHFIGISIASEISEALSVGGSLAEFRTLLNITSRIFMLNAKYDSYPFVTQAEAVARFVDVTPTREVILATYVQSMYHIDSNNALVTRLEYIDDDLDWVDDTIAILGYSYRPLYPISLKAEYQWHKKSALNGLHLSFSVLF